MEFADVDAEQDIDLLVTRIQNLLMQTLTSKVWD